MINDQNKNSLSLLNVNTKSQMRVIKISGGKEILKRLHDFGIYPGGLIKLIKKAPFGGPLLIEDLESKSKIVIDTKLASNIHVEQHAIGNNWKKINNE